MVNQRKQLGRRGELMARRYLERLGYVVVATNFATRAGEIDIVCLDGETLVFVEVKTRRSQSFGGPVEAISGRKQQRFEQAIAAYCAQHPEVSAHRIDVVAITFDLDGGPRIDYRQNAWAVDGENQSIDN